MPWRAFEFALLAENFLLLQLDLLLLLDDLHLHFFRLHKLAGFIFLQVVGELWQRIYNKLEVCKVGGA